MKAEFDCIVVGAGPGGLTAALYLRRFQRKVLVVDGGKPRAAWIPKTKNLIGYQGGISGPTLLRRLRAQLAELKTVPRKGEARVNPRGKGFTVEVSGERFTARKVILATGIEDHQPPVAGIAELRKLGLLRYCPVCDGFEHRKRRLLVFVNSADCFGKIFFLFQYSRKITVITPKLFRPPRELLHGCRRLKVSLIREELRALRKTRSGIRAEFANGRSVEAEAAYVELGFRVRDGAFSHIPGLQRAPDGRLRVDAAQRTNLPGLFAVGDCVANLAQISVAAGQAAVAATEIHNELLGRT